LSIGGLSLWRRPGNIHGFRKAVFFDGVQLPLRWHRAACFIPDRITGSVLVRVGERPPQIGTILAYKGFDQVAAIFVLGHLDLVPTDRDLIAVPGGCHIFRRPILVVPNGLQVRFCEIDGGDVTHYIDH